MGDQQRRGRDQYRWLWLFGVAAGLIFLYLVRSILPPFLIGATIAYVLAPTVARIQERWAMPRGVAIALLYVALLGPFVVLLIALGPRLFVETRELIGRTPFLLTRLIEQTFGLGPYSIFGTSVGSAQVSQDLIDLIRGSLGTPTIALRLAAGVVDFAANAILALIVSIYLLADSASVNRLVFRLVPVRQRDDVEAASEAIHRTLARYLSRELMLVAFVATVTFIGLELLFHLRFSLVLAVFTGFVEIVPFLGPVTAAVLAALIAVSQGGVQLATEVIVFYVVLRQVEDQIVMPIVLGRAVSLHPLIVLFAVLAGGALFGVLGTLIAVPVAASVKVIVDYWPRLRPAPAPPVIPDDEDGVPGPP
jgi:predicted PurR-regulated permease PerM